MVANIHLRCLHLVFVFAVFPMNNGVCSFRNEQAPCVHWNKLDLLRRTLILRDNYVVHAQFGSHAIGRSCLLFFLNSSA